MKNTVNILDKGFIRLRNLSGPIRRTRTYEEYKEGMVLKDSNRPFDADDTDPAITARISFNNLEARARELDLKLYEYLISNLHTTPVEMIETWWDIKVPMAIGEQILRHRTATINKISGRYTDLGGEWYIPSKYTVGVKSKSNKQGRDLIAWRDLTFFQKLKVLSFLKLLNVHNTIGHFWYKFFTKLGIAPELCRFFLQANHYTVFVYKQDLHNLMHFLSLRLDNHAQYEARQVAAAMYELLSTYLPKSMEYFDTYRRMLTEEELAELAIIFDLGNRRSLGLNNSEERKIYLKLRKRFLKR